MKTSETTLREIYDISNKEVKEKMKLEFPTLFKKSSILNEAISYLTEVDDLCKIIKAKINLQEGNITEQQYNEILG